LPGVTGLPAAAFLSLAPGKGAYAVAQCHRHPERAETRREPCGLWRCGPASSTRMPWRTAVRPPARQSGATGLCGKTA